MNSFGKIFKVQIFGESHGPQVGVCIDGCIPGLEIKEEYFLADLKRRQGGNQKATTPRKEADLPNIISGVFNGHTTGTPITILLKMPTHGVKITKRKKKFLVRDMQILLPQKSLMALKITEVAGISAED